jgi:DNA polymerase-3 subunit alpha
MAFSPFVPLHVLSSYSLLEGANDPAALADLSRKRGFPAIAITDRNGLYGVVPFAKACVKAGIQPIIGALLGVLRPDIAGTDTPVIDALLLLVQDEVGYANLCSLVSEAHLDRPLELPPHVALEALSGKTDGLIALTAAGEGALARLVAGGQESQAEGLLRRLRDLFGDRLYVELARRGDRTEEAAEATLIDWAYRYGLPLVATNPASFGEPEMHEAHDAMLCIASSSHLQAEERARSNPASFVKSGAMMEELFADLPEAMSNTLTIARRCAFLPPERAPILPSLAGDQDGEAKALARDGRRGLEERLSAYHDLTEEERQRYRERLDYEIGIINGMGFPGYFLIVADFIKWAKDNGIPVGPGRGSGAGSLVAWALTITDLDPIRLGLLFERFLNPERVSMPDFDIDFCETRRGEVIRYVQGRYGSDHVAQIITFGKLKARAVLRDCGRILQMSYGHVDRLCKMVPNHPTDPWDLRRTLEGVSEFRAEYRKDREVRQLVDLAIQLEGFPRNSSTHAAGVVIGDRPISELVPLYRDPRSDMPVTQFDMKHVETTGLVKFDFLGLKTLSVLRRATELLAERGIDLDLEAIPPGDPRVFELLKAGDTVGVFQLESEGMRRTLTAVKPSKFEDIIALVSLYRPGPMDNIPLFGRRKAGEEPIEYPHPKLEAILAETYGIFVYQEQVMQAAQLLAGYSLGEADLLRRAMGKKVQAEMDAQRQRFVDGCLEISGIEAGEANRLFDLIDKFAGYGFNKSHAAAYAVLAYQTAWLKAHYREDFYAASMCFDMHQSEKLSVLIEDARRSGCTVLPPSIQTSDADFTTETTADGLAIRYALAGLRNVGEKAMHALVEERRAGGEYSSLPELCARLPHGVLNRRQLESLVGGGAFDELEPDRALLMTNCDLLLAHADAAARERSSGQAGLFGEGGTPSGPLRMKAAAPWSKAERMAKEREAFGFYFSQHPTQAFREVAKAHGVRSYASLIDNVATGGAGRVTARMAAMVEGVRKGRTRRGGDFVRCDLSDHSGQFTAACFEDDFVPSFGRWAEEGTCLLLTAELEAGSAGEPPRLTIRGAEPLEKAAAGVRLALECDLFDETGLAALQQELTRAEGSEGQGEVIIRVTAGSGTEAGVSRILIGTGFKLDGELAERLATSPGLGNIELNVQKGAGRLRLVA